MLHLSADTEQVRTRSRIYGLLSLLFRAEPDASLLRELRSPHHSETLADAGLDLPPEADDAQLCRELQREYRRLFVLGLPPYESICRAGGFFWREVTAELQDEVDDLGPAFRFDSHLPPDHLANEFAVMHHLTKVQAALLEQGGPEEAAPATARQRRFLRQHVLRWAPGYLAKVQAESVHPFYAGAARLALRFLWTEAGLKE